MQSTDRRTVPFLDVLIECELKQVIANSAVQSYTSELWKGGIGHWAGYKTFLFLASFALFPPLWLVFSLPLDNKYNKTPIVKFGCHLTSHLYFMAFQIMTSCVPLYPIYRASLSPFWVEWIVLVWLSGLLLEQLTEPQDRHGLGAIKVVIIVLNWIAVGIHIAAFFVDKSYWPLLIYIRNQFGGFSFLCCCIQVLTTTVSSQKNNLTNRQFQILDFLSFHHFIWALGYHH